MKYIASGCFLIWLLSSCGGTEPEGDIDLNPEDSIVEYDVDEERLSAVEFNNQLTLMQEDALNQITILFQSDSSNIDQNYDNVLFELEIYLSDLKQMKVVDGGQEYLNKTKELIFFYQDELNGEFKEIKPLLKKPELSESELNRLDEYDRNFAEKEKEAFDAIFTAQEKFASKHNIQLQDH